MTNVPGNLSTLDAEGDPFTAAVANLPPLPKTIVYEDDYTEKRFSLRVDESEERVRLSAGGSQVTLDFLSYEPRVRGLIRVFLLGALLDYSATTISYWHYGLRSVPAQQIEDIAMSNPAQVRTKWPLLRDSLSTDTLLALKRLIEFLCTCRFGLWEPLYQALGAHLPLPRRDAYAVVRAGDCFLELDEEAALVRWIDDAALNAERLPPKELVAACLVACAYQFGMRPIQLGMLRKRDCSVRTSTEDGTPIVHLTFRTVKQQDEQASRLPLLRKVKREWAPLLSTLFATLKDAPSDSFLFGLTSRNKASSALIAALAAALPARRRVGYDLRHSMAQRMVDAGASQEELAAALGHTHLKTGLVYFRASANQAELVNKALGLSETYQTVAKIAADRFISEEELEHLKGEQQIAGVPHGIPIAGIGGCKTGQPSCPYNPVTACYGCPKFMPVRDVALHEQVLKDFRGVVNEFRVAGAGDQESPAYLQLRRTIAEVQAVINQLEGRDVQ